MPHGPRPTALRLPDLDREALERLERRPGTAQALALRARIVLACAREPAQSHVAIAQDLHVNRSTVGQRRPVLPENLYFTPPGYESMRRRQEDAPAGPWFRRGR